MYVQPIYLDGCSLYFKPYLDLPRQTVKATKTGLRLDSNLVELTSLQRDRKVIDGWVNDAKAGELGAFEHLYRYFYKRVYALCLRMTANEALAEELMQEAFVMAWRKISQFHGDSQFGTWLYRLTSNLVISFFRTKKNQPLEGEDYDTLHSGHEAEKLHLKRDLERAIAELPTRARMVLVLHDIEGYKHQEIAEKMAISEGACKAQLHRARALLKARFS